MGRLMEGWVDRQIDGRAGGLMDRLMGRLMDRLMEGWVDRKIDGRVG